MVYGKYQLLFEILYTLYYENYIIKAINSRCYIKVLGTNNYASGNGQVISYIYDRFERLIKKEGTNGSTEYTYDAGGNIVTKKEYLYTTGNISEETLTNTINYTYANTNWKDQLTSYNGKAITYDEIGNPTSYDGATYTWQNGRELASITKNGTTIQYKYNDSGIRTSKIINGTETKYHLEGSNVVYEMTGNTRIYYTYDENGDIIGLTYSGNEITDTTNIGLINPYRYRSYRYDSEIGMYYLNSRYYNPEWGRFLNRDKYGGKVGGLLSHNIYIYIL